MTFNDRLFSAIGTNQSADALSTAYGVAQSTATPKDAAAAAAAIGPQVAGRGQISASAAAAMTHTPAPNANTFDPVAWALNKAAIPGNTVLHAFGTLDAFTSTADAYEGGDSIADRMRAFASGSVWKQAWAKSNSGDIGVDIAHQFTPGGFNTEAYTQTPDQAGDYHTPAFDDFASSTAGRFAGAAINMGITWYLDPTVIGGKALAASRLARATLGATDVAPALKVVRGELTPADVTRVQARGASKIDSWIKDTDNQSLPQLAADPRVRAASDGGIMAQALHRANQIPDMAERHATKADIIGVSLADPDAVLRLQSRQAVLAESLQGMMDSIPEAEVSLNFSWNDMGQGVLVNLNSPLQDKNFANRLNDITNEMETLNRQYAAIGSSNKVGLDLLDRGLQKASDARLKTAIMHDGLGSPPRMMITGVIGKAAPGHINTVDATDGLNGLRLNLEDSERMAGDEKISWLERFNGAATRGQRNAIVRAVEQRNWDLEAEARDLSPSEFDRIRNSAQGRGATYRSLMASRLYSALDRGESIVSLRDEDGVNNVFYAPFLKSQLEDMTPLSNPKDIKSLLDKAEQGKFHNAVDDSWRVGEVLMRGATRGWKDLQLFRGAYPLRVQADTQTRLVTALGIQRYLHMAGQGAVNVGRNWKTITVEDTLALADKTQALRELDDIDNGLMDVSAAELKTIQERATQDLSVTGRRRDLARQGYVAKASSLTNRSTYHGVDVSLVPNGNFDLDQQARRLSTSDTYLATAVGDQHSEALANLRQDEGWGVVDAKDPLWADAYKRAVNKQFRNSPVMQRLLTDPDDASVSRWVLKNPAALAEWHDFAHAYDGDINAWLNELRMHQTHLLPTPELQAIAAKRSITDADLETHFPKGQGRMQVHGQNYIPAVEKNALMKTYEKTTGWWYRHVSDLPEEVLGRHPFMSAKFSDHMKSLIDRAQAAGIDYASPDELLRMRKVALTLAKRDLKSVMYDISSMPHVADAVAFVMPFFRPWMDVMQKWGKLMWDDPSRLAHAGQIVNGVRDHFAQPGDSGKSYITIHSIPGMDRLGLGGISERIPLSNLNVIGGTGNWWFPGTGPIVNLGADELIKHKYPKQADNWFVKLLLPYGASADNSVADEFEPTWMKNAYTALHGNSENSQEYAQIYSAFEAQSYIDHAKDGVPLKNTNELANQTRNWFLLKLATNELSPVSMQPQAKYQLYIDTAHAYQAQDAQIRQVHQAWTRADPATRGDEPPDGWASKFYQDFPDYFEASLSLSQNNTGIIASDKAYDASQKYKKLIAQHPEDGWLVVGDQNVGAFSSGVYTYQASNSIGYGQAEKYRGKNTKPQQAIDQVETEKGWLEYNQAMTAYNLALQQRGLTPNQAASKAPDLYAMKQQYVAQLSGDNQAWAAAYLNINSGTLQTLLQNAQSMMKMDSSFKQRPDMVNLQTYIDGRQALYTALQQRSSHNVDNPTNADLAAMWDHFTQQLIQGNVGFEQIWNRALERDDPSKPMALETSQ